MLKVEELEKQVNSGVAEGIYLFYGAETFLLEQQVKKMKKADIESKVYSQYDEQFQGLAWIALLLLIVDVFIVDRKNSWLKKITFFS